MKILRNVLALATVLLSPVAAAEHQSRIDSIAPEALPAYEVVRDFSLALAKGDLARAEALLAPEVVVLESGSVESSREEYMQHHAPADSRFLQGAQVYDLGVTARAEGDFAWVATRSHVVTTREGKPLGLQSTETMLLKRRDGVWRIVHIHWSSRPEPASKG